MGLNWDITNCKNMESLQVEETGEWAITNALIWLTMGVDLGNITETNIGEFYARTKVWEFVSGPMTSKFNLETNNWDEYTLTFADIHKRIGLSTNVSNVPITAWLKRIDRVMAESNWVSTKQVSKNKIKAIYYTAIAEVENYSASTEKELENA